MERGPIRRGFGVGSSLGWVPWRSGIRDAVEQKHLSGITAGRRLRHAWVFLAGRGRGLERRGRNEARRVEFDSAQTFGRSDEEPYEHSHRNADEGRTDADEGDAYPEVDRGGQDQRSGFGGACLPDRRRHLSGVK